MSSNAHRKCAKCGATAAEDGSVQFHRFPLPGTTNILRATAWATYCWPEQDWSSLESLTANYKKGKVLCARHFLDSCYTDSSKKRLSKFAVPGTTEYITKTIECLRSKIFSNAKTLNSSSRDAPVAGSAHSDTSVGRSQPHNCTLEPPTLILNSSSRDAPVAGSAHSVTSVDRSQPDNCTLEPPTLIDDTSQNIDAGCSTPPDTPVGETPTQQVQLKLMGDTSQDTPVAGCSTPTDTPVEGTPTQQVQLKLMVDTSKEIAVAGRSAHPVIVVDTTPTHQHAAQITVMVNTPQESPVAGGSTPPASPEPTLMDTDEPKPAKEPKKTRKGILQAIKKHKLSQLTETEMTLYKMCKSKVRELQKLRKMIKDKKKIDKEKNTCDEESLRKLLDSNDSESLNSILQNQLLNSRKKLQGRRYNLEQKLLALTLYKKCPACYPLFRRIFSLPCQNTLKTLGPVNSQCSIEIEINN